MQNHSERTRYEPCPDSDHQMFMQQDGLDAYGADAPCLHCGEHWSDHTEEGYCVEEEAVQGR